MVRKEGSSLIMIRGQKSRTWVSTLAFSTASIHSKGLDGRKQHIIELTVDLKEDQDIRADGVLFEKLVGQRKD